MNEDRGRIVLGVILLLMGAFFLATNFEVIPTVTAGGWVLFFGVVSLLFFVAYFASGVRNWGWLFPALGTGAIAALIWLGEAGQEGAYMGSLFLFSVALPFWAAFLVDRRENWWATIPGWVLVVISVLILFEGRLGGEAFGGLVMYSIALPFLIVYARNRENWWALIPAGVLSTVGTTALLAGLPVAELALARMLGAVFFGGLALTFAALWLLRQHHPTEWAKYPAIGLGAVALVAVVLGAQQQFLWPVLLIAGGGWLFYRSLRAKAEA